eukprot:15471500-Alexandrium_andersonii.AAC.1
MRFAVCSACCERICSLSLPKCELTKELPGPKKLHFLKCAGDAGALHLDEPDEAAGPRLEVLGLAGEGWGVELVQALGNQRLVLLDVE